MNSLLTLAKDLEQKSKAQQQSTEQMLKAVFSEHEKFVSEELNASAKRISAAISAHEKGMTEAMQSNRLNVLRMVGRTWLTITMVSILLICFSGGVLLWLGQKIVTNTEALIQQEDALAKLNAKTWGVSFHEEKGEKFLVLPKGMTSDKTRDWTRGYGKEKQNLVRLLKE